jgi:hypothetical protein
MRPDAELDALIADVAIARKARADAQNAIVQAHGARDAADVEIKAAERRLQDRIEQLVGQHR